MRYCQICKTNCSNSVKSVCDICLKPIYEKHINCDNIKKQIKKIKKLKTRLLDEEYVLFHMEHLMNRETIDDPFLLRTF